VAVLLAAALAALPGCDEASAAESCEPRETYRPYSRGTWGLELLFVIDNSPSMASAQAALAEALPNMLRTLSTGDLDGDGGADFMPPSRVSAGVISTDMGTGGLELSYCAASDFGDDGVLRTSSGATTSECRASYPSFLTFSPFDDVAALGEDLACLARVGTDGCDVEQPFEAMLKALAGSDGSTAGRFDGRFGMGTVGHADDSNAGFGPLSGLLTIIELTDDDDCSVLDPEVLNPTSSIYSGEPTHRCITHPEALQPIGRYVDGLMDLSLGYMIYAPIIGVPETLLTDPLNLDYRAILADPAMQTTVDPSNPERQLPSCTSPSGGHAMPPRRHVELAQELDAEGAEVILHSLCGGDLVGPLRAIAERLGWVVDSLCLGSALSRDDDGFVDCEMTQVLPVGERCADLPGRTRIGEEDAGPGEFAEVCRVEQLPVLGGAAGAGDGWYIDDFSARAAHTCGAGAQRLAYSSSVLRTLGWWSRFDCAISGFRDVWDIGSPCPAPGTGCVAGDAFGGRTCRRDLVCDPATTTLQRACVDDGDCWYRNVCGVDGFCTSENCW